MAVLASDDVAPHKWGMSSERRGRQRVRGPFEASWSGTSGHRRVRVADVSVSGCFIEDLATPAIGDRVDVTLFLPHELEVQATGRVVYLYPAQGFAVTFEHDERSSVALEDAVARLGG